MHEIGDLLRKRREELGISLAAAQAATKIRMRYLEAMEKGEDLSYPGEVYYRGFMKSYASFLGLDGAEILARYKALKEARESEAPAGTQPSAGAAAQPPVEREPSPSLPPVESAPRPVAARACTPERIRARARRRRSARQAAVLALAIAACGLFFVRWHGGTTSRGRATPPVEPSAQPAAGPAIEPQEPPDASGTPETPATPGGEAGTTPPPAPGEETSPGPAGESKPSVEYTREEKSKGLTAISAKVESIVLVGEVQGGQCWVRVEADGALAQEAMLQPGSTHTWEARERLYIRVGAPAAMRLKLNGVDLGQAGPEGPARDFVITVEKGD